MALAMSGVDVLTSILAARFDLHLEFKFRKSCANKQGVQNKLDNK